MTGQNEQSVTGSDGELDLSCESARSTQGSVRLYQEVVKQFQTLQAEAKKCKRGGFGYLTDLCRPNQYLIYSASQIEGETIGSLEQLAHHKKARFAGSVRPGRVRYLMEERVGTRSCILQRLSALPIGPKYRIGASFHRLDLSNAIQQRTRIIQPNPDSRYNIYNTLSSFLSCHMRYKTAITMIVTGMITYKPSA